jgi:26S proteasome regulatory subunit T5
MAAELEAAWGGQNDSFLDDVALMRNDEIKQSIRALDNEIRIMKSDIARIKNESTKQRAHIKDNKEKIKVHN